MPFSHLRNRHHRTQFAGILIAVSIIHIVIIQSVWSHPVNTLANPENISFLESFAVQAEDATQAQNTNPEEKNVQDRYPENSAKETTPLMPYNATETPVSKNHVTPKPLQPGETKTPQDSYTKKLKLSRITPHPNSHHHNTDNSQTSITPPNAHANFLSNPPPTYPRQSRRLGEQGKVVLTAEIAINGKALQALINISSGYPRLDQAALDSVLNWRFIPGNKAGVAQKMWVNIPINFILE